MVSETMFKYSFSPWRFYADFIVRFIVFKRQILWVILFLTFSLQAQDFLWIGGTGNWSDPANWSSSSGGIPTALDNVIFDASSFSANEQTLRIDKDASCKNMDWSAISKTARLAGNKSLTVYGSMKLNQNMTIVFIGDIYFEAKKNENAIDFAGHQMKSNLYFDGKGQWNFTNDVDIGQQEFSLQKGKIDTKGKTLSCGSFYSIGQENREINLNASTVKITDRNGKWLNSRKAVLKLSFPIPILCQYQYLMVPA